MIVPELLGHLGLCALSPKVSAPDIATAEKTEAPFRPGIICTLDFSSFLFPLGPLTVDSVSHTSILSHFVDTHSTNHRVFCLMYLR